MRSSWGCTLLAWSVLLQAVSSVEQRTMLRVRQGREAAPVVTLPHSLLLQTASNEDAHSKVVNRARTAYFSDGQGGHEQDDGNDDTDGTDSDEETDTTTAAATETTTAAAAATTTAATTTTVATTTVATTTTEDPALVYAEEKKGNETVKTRHLLVTMITKAQADLLKRLRDIDIDLDATELRAQADLKAVNFSFTEAAKMPIMARNAEVDVQKLDDSGGVLKAELPNLVSGAQNASARIASFLGVKNKVDQQLDETSGLSGAKGRVETNQQTMKALYPRLNALEKKVFSLEGKLYGGNMTKVVNDAAREEVMNIFEDVGRGFGRFYENQE
jgi:hypothetical protein